MASAKAQKENRSTCFTCAHKGRQAVAISQRHHLVTDEVKKSIGDNNHGGVNKDFLKDGSSDVKIVRRRNGHAKKCVCVWLDQLDDDKVIASESTTSCSRTARCPPQGRVQGRRKYIYKLRWPDTY